MACNIFNKMISIFLTHYFSEQCSWLFIVIIRVLIRISTNLSYKWKWSNTFAWFLNRSVQWVWLIVRANSSISCHIHWPISLIIWNSCSVWTVNRNVVMVSSKSMPVGIRIRKKSALEHFIVRKLNAWNSICWSEGCLLNFSKIILWISVEGHFSYRD